MPSINVGAACEFSGSKHMRKLIAAGAQSGVIFKGCSRKLDLVRSLILGGYCRNDLHSLSEPRLSLFCCQSRKLGAELKKTPIPFEFEAVSF